MDTPVVPPSGTTQPTVAPSAAAPTPIETMAQMAEYARNAVNAANADAQGQPAPIPAAPAPLAAQAGQESPPAQAAAEATPEPVIEGTPASDPSATDDVPEVTPEEEAGLSDAGVRALRAEREQRKAAKRELKDLKSQFDELKAKLESLQTPNAAPTAPVVPPTAPVAPAPQPSLGAQVLTDCTNFEQVDALALQAVTAEVQALTVKDTLALHGAEQAAAQLASFGVRSIDGVPVAQASDEQIRSFLNAAYANARATQFQAGPRKQFLEQQAIAFVEAAKIVPELADPKSPRGQRFVKIITENPWLRQQGPNWPVIAAKFLRGDEATAAPAAPKAAVPAPAPVAPRPKPAPGAPRVSGPSAAATPSELDALSAKMKSGTATIADMNRYASLQVRVPA